MKRQIRSFAAGLLAIGAFSSPVRADQGQAPSPFPVSTMYGSADQRAFPSATGDKNYSGRFDGYGSGYGAGGRGGPEVVLFGAVRLFPPLILVVLPVMGLVLVAQGLNAAAANAPSAE